VVNTLATTTAAAAAAAAAAVCVLVCWLFVCDEHEAGV
jgi:hypothetical protein